MNESGLASLDKIGLDKRVASITKVGLDKPIRIELNHGWVWVEYGDSIAYFTGIKDAWHAFRHGIRSSDASLGDPVITSGPDAMPGLKTEPEVLEDDDTEVTSEGRGQRAIDAPVRNTKWRCPACTRWTTDPMAKTCQACREKRSTASEIAVDKV